MKEIETLDDLIEYLEYAVNHEIDDCAARAYEYILEKAKELKANMEKEKIDRACKDNPDLPRDFVKNTLKSRAETPELFGEEK